MQGLTVITDECDFCDKITYHAVGIVSLESECEECGSISTMDPLELNHILSYDESYAYDR